MNIEDAWPGPYPVKNIPLMEKVYDHILLFPEEWDQAHWGSTWSGFDEGISFGGSLLPSCGTAHCFAGHAVSISNEGARFIFQPVGDEARDVSIANVVELPGGAKRPVLGVARKELGLDDDEAGWLFGGHNSLAMIRAILDWWIEGNDGVNEDLTDKIMLSEQAAVTF